MKRLIKKVRLIAIGTVVVGGSVFFSCQKETDNTDLQNTESVSTKTRKLMGDHQQPTHIVDIDTIVSVGNNNYSIVGSVVIGDFDRRIYECDILWEIPNTGASAGGENPTVIFEPIIGGGNESYQLQLTATLKFEYEDILLIVAPGLGCYDIQINDVPVEANYNLILNNSITITYQDVSDFWERIGEICNSNIVINYPFILPIEMEPFEYAIYENDFSGAFEDMLAILNNCQEEEKGYFILSLNASTTLMYYGFISESSIYYNPNILIDSLNDPYAFVSDHPLIIVGDEDDDDEPMMYGIRVRRFRSPEKAEAWVIKKRENGWNAGMVGNIKNKIICIAYK